MHAYSVRAPSIATLSSALFMVVLLITGTACSSGSGNATTSAKAETVAPEPTSQGSSSVPTSTVASSTATVASSTTSSTSTAASSTTSDTTPTPTPTFGLIPATEPAGSVTHGTLTFDGRERTYRLYVPRDLPGGPVPLFVGLHGGTGWGDQFARTNHIEGLAESNGFIVVHPDGVTVADGPGGVWNGGVCCGVAARENVDDVGFIRTLIDQIATTYSVDPHRVYAFGHSNGAIMSYRLACELADRIVGIGLYAGTLGIETCNPSQSVSILHVHGTADTNIPIAGGVGPDAISGVSFPPPRDGFDTLSQLDGCPSPTTITARDVITELSDPCTAGAAAAFVTIETANHSWPGGTPIVTPASGPGYADYDATAAIVTFLLSHPRP